MRANHRRFLACYKGEVIAAAEVRFYRGGLVEFANNCSRDEYLHLCPNDLLVWRMIQWACENGFPRISTGGAHPFLRKWSDTVIPVYRYRLDRTLLHYVELKDEATMQTRLLFKRLPTRLQTALRTLLRHAA
jgi:CelD/BcsL family acetyltransferase involved in cellulose biosynthesis